MLGVGDMLGLGVRLGVGLVDAVGVPEGAGVLEGLGLGLKGTFTLAIAEGQEPSPPTMRTAKLSKMVVTLELDCVKDTASKRAAFRARLAGTVIHWRS